MRYVVRGPIVDGGTRYRPGNPSSGRAGFFVGQGGIEVPSGLGNKL